ncbi:MAG: filamentous hemagglutinin N-terminal domain-containing protein, partial [Candidatus Pacebacteria bacterium]|nr:filamentous hemagglutinin N-terminal domain-containing protein [Candidatus Paceibacterota bacterium]
MNLNRWQMAKTPASTLKMAVSLAAIMVVKSVPLLAAPVGGTVEAGTAEIGFDGQATTVLQSSDRAVISWQSFNLAANESVNFVQPAATSATLNRILDSGVSQIAGTIHANGTVYFTNPNGLVFDATSRVTANGFIASTVAPSAAAFMNGRELGVATVGGTIGLNGTITAQRLFALAGSLAVNGTLDASSAVQAGGKLELTASGAVTIGPAAVISASGAMGGGTIAIGGNFKGEGPLLNAASVTVASGARISADANGTGVGDGGSVVLWSQQQTSFAGAISSRGAAAGGNGGTVEVSGLTNLVFRGTVDNLAPKGKTGTLFLDPTKISILSAAPETPPTEQTVTNGVARVAGNATSYLLISNLEAALATSNVTIDASTAIDGEIELGDEGSSIRWTSGNSLTLTAKAAITIKAGTINAGTTGSIIFNTNNGDIKLGNKNPSDGSAANITITAGSLFMTLGTGKITDDLGERIDAEGATAYYQGGIPTGGVNSKVLNLGASGRFVFVTVIPSFEASTVITIGANGIVAPQNPATPIDPIRVQLSDYRVTAGSGQFSLTGIYSNNSLNLSALKASPDYDALAYIRGKGIGVTGTIALKQSLLLDSSAWITVVGTIGSNDAQANGRSLSLVADQYVNQTNGVIQADGLTVTTRGGFYLGGNNRINWLGRVRAGGDSVLVVDPAINLVLKGDINLGTAGLDLRAGGLILDQNINLTAGRATIKLVGSGGQNGTLAAGSRTLNFSGADLYYLGAAPTITDGGQNAAIAVGSGRFTQIIALNSATNLAVSDTGYSTDSGTVVFGNNRLLDLHVTGTGNPTNGDNEALAFYGFEVNGSVKLTATAGGTTTRLTYLRAAGVTVASDFMNLPSLTLISSGGIIIQGSMTSAAGSSLSLYSQGWIRQKSGVIDTSRLTMTSARTAALGSGIDLGSANRIAALGNVNGDTIFDRGAEAGIGQVLVRIADNLSLSLDGNISTGGKMVSSFIELSGTNLTLTLARNLTLDAYLTRLDLGDTGLVAAGNFTLSGGANALALVYNGLEPTTSGGTNRAIVFSLARFVLLTPVNEDVTLTPIGIIKASDSQSLRKLTMLTWADRSTKITVGAKSQGIVAAGKVTVTGFDNTVVRALRYIKGNGIEVTAPLTLDGSQVFIDSSADIKISAPITLTTATGNLTLIARGGDIVQDGTGTIVSGGLMVRGNAKVSLANPNQLGILYGLNSGGDSLFVQKDEIDLKLSGDLNLGNSNLELRAGNVLLSDDITVVGRQLDLVLAKVKTVTPLTYQETVTFDGGNFTLTGDGVSLRFMGSAVKRGRIISNTASGTVYRAMDLGNTGKFTQLWRYNIAEDITIDNTGVYSTVNPNYKLLNYSLINLAQFGVIAGGNNRNSDDLVVAYQEISSSGSVTIGLIDGLNLGMTNLVRVEAAGIKITGTTRFTNALTLVSSKDIEFNQNLTVLNGSGSGSNGLTVFANGLITQNGGTITANQLTASAKNGISLAMQNDIAQLGPINQSFTINDRLQSGGGKVVINASGGVTPRSLKLGGIVAGDSVLLRANGLILTKDIAINGQSLSLDLGGGGIEANGNGFKITSDAERLFFSGDFSDSAAGTTRLSLTKTTAQFYRTEFSSSDSFILGGRAESALPATAPSKPNWVTGGVTGAKSALFASKEVSLEATTTSVTYERDSNGDEILTRPIVTPLNPPYDYFGYDYIAAETIKVAGTASGISFKDSVTLTATNDIILNSGVTVKNGGSLTLTAGGAIVQTGGVITADQLGLTAGGRIYLGQGNSIVKLNAVTAGGAVTIKNAASQSLVLGGDIDLGKDRLWLSAKDLSLNQSITVTARQVTLRSLNGGLNAGLFTLTAAGADMTYTGSAPVTTDGGSNQAIDLGTGIFTYNKLNHSTEAVVFDSTGVKSGSDPLTLITSLSLADYKVTAGGTGYSFETQGSLSIKSGANLSGLPSLTATSVTLEDGLQLTAPLTLTATDADGTGIVLSGAITATNLTLNSRAGITQDSGSLLTTTRLNLTAMKAATIKLGNTSGVGDVNQGFNFEAQFSQPTAAVGQVSLVSAGSMSLGGNLLGNITITAASLTLAQAVTVNGSGSVLTLNLGSYSNGATGYGLTARYNRLIFNNTAFNLTGAGTGPAIDVGGGSLTVNYSASGNKNLSDFNLLTSDRLALTARDRTTGQTTLGQFLTTVQITDGTLTVDRAVVLAAVSLTTIGTGSIQVNAPLTAMGSLSLNSAGDIGQNAAGAIQLLGNQGQASLVAGGTLQLTNKNNDLRSLSVVSSGAIGAKLSLVTRYGMVFTDRLTSGGAIDLSSGGAIGFYGAAVTVGGDAGLTIKSLATVTGDQDSVLTVGGGGLSGSAVGGFFLEGLNRITTLGSLVNQSVGGIRLRNSLDLTIAKGSLLQGGEGGVQLVLVNKDLSLGGSLPVQGAWLRLDFGDIYHGLKADSYGINAKGVDLYYYGAAPTIKGIDHAAIDIGTADYIGIVNYNNSNLSVLVLDQELQIGVAVAPTTIRANGARLSYNQVFTGIKSNNQLRITGSGDGLLFDIDHTTAGRLRYIEGNGILMDSQRSYKQGLMLVSSRGSVTLPDPLEPASLAVKVTAGIVITAGLGVEGEGNDLVLIDEYRNDNRLASGIQVGIYIVNSAVSSVSSNLTMIQA